MSVDEHDRAGSFAELVRKGNAAAKAGDAPEARICFEAALAREPESPVGWQGVARCLQLEGDWAGAVEVFRRLIERHPGHQRQPFWTRRLVTCLEKDGRRAEAVALLERDLRNSEAGARYLEAVTNKDDGTQHGLRFDHVLIITYGRTGSTLLQGVLNSINGLLVRGENANAFYHLFELHRTLRDNERAGATLLPTSAWFGFGEMGTDAVLAQMRPFAKQLLLGAEADNPAVTACGFKEIRYFDVADDLVEYLQFLERLFPRVAFVFNTRERDETMESGWWASENKDETAAAFAQLDSMFSQYAAERDHCFEISYADVVERTARLEGLFTFLGAPFDHQRVSDVLAVPHSYQPKEGNGSP